ncbi:MAG: hypothetical protein J7L46_03250, partial [Bacteroidales bacterium]|nr:hypothetical protein [Bacteroidales bacterium]
YYNIEKLIGNTNGNEAFILNLITVFVEKNQVDNFLKLLDNRDFDNLTAQLHKIKSNLPYLAQPEIVDNISNLHLLALNKKEKELNEELPSVVNDLKKLIKELNEKFIG